MSFDTSGGTDNAGIVSTKNGNNIGYSVASKSDEWITFNNGDVTVGANTSENSRSGSIILKQNESGNTITIQVSQDGVEPTPPPTTQYTVTVNPTPSDAKVVINNRVTKTITLDEGSLVEIEVSKTGYRTYNDTIESLQENKTIPVTLIRQYKVTVDTIPEDAVVKMNGDIIDSKEAYFDVDTRIVITADKIGYKQGKDIIESLQQDETRTITLQEDDHDWVFDIDPTDDYIKSAGTPGISPTVTSTEDGATIGFSVDDNSPWLIPKIENGIVTITAYENRLTTPRNGFVRFIQNESDRTCTINITQYRADEFLVNGSSIKNVSADRHIETLNVLSIVDGLTKARFTVESNKPWINANVGLNFDSIVVIIEANDNYTERTGTITCTQTNTGTVVEVPVTQAAKVNTYELNVFTTSFEINSDGDTVSTRFVSTLNGEYNEPTITPDKDWINAEPISDGNNHSISITIAANTDTTERSGIVTVVNGDKSETITITQEGASQQDVYEFSVNKNSVSFNADGNPAAVGANVINVTSKKNGSRFDTAIDPPDWVHVDRDTTVDGTSYRITTDDIQSVTPRYGNIVITQNRTDGTSPSEIIEVSQEGHAYQFDGEFVDGVVITQHETSKTITPKVIVDDVESADPVTVVSIGFADGAPYQNKFSVTNLGTAFKVSGVGTFEQVNTELEVTLQYKDYTETFGFGLDWAED